MWFLRSVYLLPPTVNVPKCQCTHSTCPGAPRCNGVFCLLSWFEEELSLLGVVQEKTNEPLQLIFLFFLHQLSTPESLRAELKKPVCETLSCICPHMISPVDVIANVLVHFSGGAH